MRKLIFFLFSLFAGFVTLWWILKAVGWEVIKIAFLTFSGPEGIAIFILTILMLFAGLWKWREILKSQGYNFSLSELSRPYFAGFSIMFLAPIVIFGGELFRAYVLRKKYDVDWQKSTASVIIDKILETTSYVFIILLGSILFILRIGLPPKNLGMILGGTFIFFLAALIFFYFKIFKKESIVKIFIKDTKNHQGIGLEKEIYSFFKPRNIFMWRGFGLSFLRIGFALVRTWVLVLFLGKTLGFFSSLSILGFYYLALMVPIPAALGSHDAIQVFAFNSFGLGAGTGAAFAMIVRGAELLLALLGLILLFRLSTELLGRILLKRIR